MGCNNSKAEEKTQKTSSLFCWRKRNKVVPINVPDLEKTGPSLNAGAGLWQELHNSLINARKTEQTALMQLKEEGIVPKKGEGGVAFVLEIGGISESDDSTSFTLPGVPECKRKSPQYSTYSQEACRSATCGRPRRLPPINKAAIDKKQERARLNRERKAAQRKAKWAKSYARVQSTMQKTPGDD